MANYTFIFAQGGVGKSTFVKQIDEKAKSLGRSDLRKAIDYDFHRPTFSLETTESTTNHVIKTKASELICSYLLGTHASVVCTHNGILDIEELVSELTWNDEDAHIDIYYLCFIDVNAQLNSLRMRQSSEMFMQFCLEHFNTWRDSMWKEYSHVRALKDEDTRSIISSDWRRVHIKWINVYDGYHLSDILSYHPNGKVTINKSYNKTIQILYKSSEGI